MPYQEPDFLPWDGQRVPITFVAGYLGAGKTTLINSLLETTDRPIAVFVNDVGAINIDARLLKRRHGDTIELTDGCICCSLSDGFGAAFDQLRARRNPPDHVVVELSGVAEPSRVIPWGRTAGFQLDGVVTLVDCDAFTELAAEPVAGLAIEAQISAADLVVLTKTDLAAPARIDAVRARVHQLAPDVPVIDGATASIATVLRLGGRRPGGPTQLPPATLFDRHTVRTHPLPRPIERAAIDHLLDETTAGAVRAKGIAVDPSGTHWAIQVVGRRRSITALSQAELEGQLDGLAQELATDLVVIDLD